MGKTTMSKIFALLWTITKKYSERNAHAVGINTDIYTILGKDAYLELCDLLNALKKEKSFDKAFTDNPAHESLGLTDLQISKNYSQEELSSCLEKLFWKRVEIGIAESPGKFGIDPNTEDMRIIFRVLSLASTDN